MEIIGFFFQMIAKAFGMIMYSFALFFGLFPFDWIFGLALIVIGILFLRDRRIAKKSKRSTQSSEPFEILKIRYARGEISKTEFEEMRHTLLHP